MALPTKKARIDDLMTRIMNNIKGSYAQHNFKLVKHSLELLRCTFQLVKEDDQYYMQCDNPSPYKVKIDVKYMNISHRFEVSENETIIYLKYRIA
jgi:hypothetical protein